jgi:hypothetical protein
LEGDRIHVPPPAQVHTRARTRTHHTAVPLLLLDTLINATQSLAYRRRISSRMIAEQSARGVNLPWSQILARIEWLSTSIYANQQYRQPEHSVNCSCNEISMDEFFARNRTCIQCGARIEEPTTVEDRWCYEYWCAFCEVIHSQPPPPYESLVCCTVVVDACGCACASFLTAVAVQVTTQSSCRVFGQEEGTHVAHLE